MNDCKLMQIYGNFRSLGMLRPLTMFVSLNLYKQSWNDNEISSF
jgi:hypothetical protein